MSDLDNGGQAFPISRGHSVVYGMTLLDWFAGQALAGLMANPNNYNVKKPSKLCYGIALAMLRDREYINDDGGDE